VERESWVVDYIDQHGSRRLKTFATRKAADDWKTTALHEVKQGTHTPASVSKTIGDAWQEWIDDCEASGLEKSTVRQRRQHLNHHVKPFIGGTKLSDLTTPIVYDFDRNLREAGRSLPMRRKVITNLKPCFSSPSVRALWHRTSPRLYASRLTIETPAKAHSTPELTSLPGAN
jgi:hypothetical protein